MVRKNMISFFYPTRKGTGLYIRGTQIVEKIGGKINPKSGYENDTCIYIKTIPPDNYPKHSYIDVDDAPECIEWIKKHPDIGVIAISKLSQENISKLLNRDDIVYIPHPHCNFEKRLRTRKEVKVVGTIGTKGSFMDSFAIPFRKKMEEIGIEFRFPENYMDYTLNRLKVADFYESLDIQVIYRPKMISPSFKNPNKLTNAGSFGIATIAWPERSYECDWDGYYLPVKSIDEMVDLVKKLRDDNDFYELWSDKALFRAEDYHIDKILKIYQSL